MQALWQELLYFAQTPAGLLILAGVAFVLASVLITGFIFFIASLFKRKPRALETSDEANGGENAPSEEAASASRDPLENFDRRSLKIKAPIALARLRAQGPDITEAAEPLLPGASTEPQPLAAPPKAEPAAEPEPAAPTPSPMPEAPQPEPFAPAPMKPKLPDPFGRANFLLTLPFERRNGLSMAHADLCGAGIEAVFFDPETVSRWDDVTLRLVPFLPQEAAKLLITESDRETFCAGELFAQPDAVIELASGLIALEYKSKGGRPEDPLRWAEAMRTKDILQTVINALVLSAESGRPAAPVLRTTNAVFFIRPTPELRALIEAKLGGAKQFLSLDAESSGKSTISASDYAELLIPIVAKLFPRPVSSGSLLGMKAHEEMLARR